MNQITVRYQSVDYVTKQRRFKTLAGARRFAQEWVGEHPEIGPWYATSFDGVGVVTVEGATLADLFPPKATPKCPRVIPSGMYWDDERGRLEFNPNESGYIAMQGDPMAIYEREDGDYDENAPSIIPGPKVDPAWVHAADGGLSLADAEDDCPF